MFLGLWHHENFIHVCILTQNGKSNSENLAKIKIKITNS